MELQGTIYTKVIVDANAALKQLHFNLSQIKNDDIVKLLFSKIKFDLKIPEHYYIKEKNNRLYWAEEYGHGNREFETIHRELTEKELDKYSLIKKLYS